MVGFRDNIPWEPPATLPDELRKAGYQTAIVGRTMHQTPRARRFGFETQDLVIGNNANETGDSDYQIALTQASPSAPDRAVAHGIAGNGWISRPWHLDESLHQVNYTVSQSIKWLKRRDPSCPFFLTVSLNPPHPPCTPPAFYIDRYMRMDLPQPAIGDWADRPPNDGLGLKPDAAQTVLEGDRNQLAAAGYYGSINHLDDQIARLFNGGMPKNTIIIMTADHGEMLGDHYLFRKTFPYEGSARVPMMFAGAGIQADAVHNGPACLEDIMPTVLELAGVEIPDSVDGTSLAPVLRGDSENPVREYLHGEHAECYGYDKQPNHFMTDGRWKYIWRTSPGDELLFDLHDDPRECRNLASDSQHSDTLAKWRNRLIKRLDGRVEGFVANGHLVAGKPYKAAMPGHEQNLV